MKRVSQVLGLTLTLVATLLIAKQIAIFQITGYHDPHNRYDPIVNGALSGYGNLGPGDYITITNVDHGNDTALWSEFEGQWTDASGSNGGGPGCGEHPDSHCPGSQ